MFDVQKKRKSWDYNIIRPNGIFGFTPHGEWIYHVSCWTILTKALN